MHCMDLTLEFNMTEDGELVVADHRLHRKDILTDHAGPVDESLCQGRLA